MPESPQPKIETVVLDNYNWFLEKTESQEAAATLTLAVVLGRVAASIAIGNAVVNVKITNPNQLRR